MYLPRRKIPEPESESDWDSSEAISTSEIASPRHRPTQRDDNTDTEQDEEEEFPDGNKETLNHRHSSRPVELETERSKPKMPTSPAYSSGRQSSHSQSRNQDSHLQKPTSPSKTPQQASNPMDRFTYTDTNQHRDSPHGSQKSRRSSNQHRADDRHSNDEPPYDFKDALIESPSERGQRSQPPGKDRKGHMYDPPASANDAQSGPDSWDDSEMDHSTKQQPRVPEKRPDEPRQKHKDLYLLNDVKGQVSSSSVFLTQKSSHGSKKMPPVTDDDALVLDIIEQSNGAMEAPANQSIPTDQNNNFQLTHHRHLYPFDQGQREYFSAQSQKSEAFLPAIADQAEKYIRRGWQEFFAILRFPVNLVFIFLVELALFVARDINSYVVQILAIVGDFLFKPLLSTIFNGFLQPTWIFVWNILIGLRSASGPLIDILKGLAQPLVAMLQAFRLVEVNKGVRSEADGP